MEHCRCAVGGREFVVAGRDPAPLLEVRESALDDVATAVVGRVERGRAPARGAATEAVADLVGRLRDDGADAAIAQVLPDRAGGVGLVAADRVGSRSRSSGWTGDAELLEERDQRGRVTGLPWCDGDDEREPSSVDEVVELRR